MADYHSMSMASDMDEIIDIREEYLDLTPRKIPKSFPSILCLGMSWFPTSAGGLNRYVYGMVDAISESNKDDSNFSIDLLGLSMPDRVGNEKDSRINLINLADSKLSLPQRLLKIRSEYSRFRNISRSAINLHFALYSFPLLNSFPDDVPITFTFHGPWALESEQEKANPLVIWAKKQLEKAVYHKCDRFIVLSHAFGEILHREYEINWDKIHVIPGGVDIQEFQPKLTQAEAVQILGWKTDRKILFTPRRLVNRMGLDRLIDAMVEVRKQVPDVWLGIAGKGPIASQLQQQIEDLDLTDQVELLGFIPDELLSVAYQAADLTVVPSISLEGFGLILVESLACGTPALSTPVGGMPEILRPLNEDLVTESIESSAIAQRLTEFLTGDRPLPSRETCRQYAVENFDWSIISPKVQHILLLPK